MAPNIIFDHRHNSHTTIALTPERHALIKQAAEAKGISQHAWIQDMITIGLMLSGPVK
jgi:hypothetical protein